MTPETYDMVADLRSILLGSGHVRSRRYESLGLAVLTFVVTFGAYALDIFTISGGVVFVPGDAALFGLLGAIWLGYRDNGLLASWVVVYAALLGYNADHSFLGLSGRSFAERGVAFLGPEGLFVLGMQAIGIGTLGFLVGALGSVAVGLLRDQADE